MRTFSKYGKAFNGPTLQLRSVCSAQKGYKILPELSLCVCAHRAMEEARCESAHAEQVRIKLLVIIRRNSAQKVDIVE